MFNRPVKSGRDDDLVYPYPPISIPIHQPYPHIPAVQILQHRSGYEQSTSNSYKKPLINDSTPFLQPTQPINNYNSIPTSSYTPSPFQSYSVASPSSISRPISSSPTLIPSLSSNSFFQTAVSSLSRFFSSSSPSITPPLSVGIAVNSSSNDLSISLPLSMPLSHQSSPVLPHLNHQTLQLPLSDHKSRIHRSPSSSSTASTTSVSRRHGGTSITHRRTPSSPRCSSESSESPLSDRDAEGLIKVKEGDLLHHGRYKVLGLAGQGTFGTVLDVIDTKHNQRLALKVVRSVPRYLEAAQIEIEILDKIRKADTHKQSLCVRLYKDFEIVHAGQRHMCLGFEKLGRSLYEFIKKNDYRGFRLGQVREFGRQLIQAVAFCHSIGLIHTDLKPENILLVSSSYELIPRKDESPYRVPKSTAIRLIDFGGATFDRDHHSRIINTRQYRAPEVLLGLGWSFPSDMWSVGCILAEIYTGELLFGTHEDLEHLALMEKILEKKIPVFMGNAAVEPWKKAERNRNQKRETERGREREKANERDGGSRKGRDRSPRTHYRSRHRRRSIELSNSSRSSSSISSYDRRSRSRGYRRRSTSSQYSRSYRSPSSPSLSPSPSSRSRSSSQPHINHLLHTSTGKLRWPGRNSTRHSLKTVKRALPLEILLSSAKNSSFIDLIKRCLEYDPEKRITAALALSHDFITKRTSSPSNTSSKSKSSERENERREGERNGRHHHDNINTTNKNEREKEREREKNDRIDKDRNRDRVRNRHRTRDTDRIPDNNQEKNSHHHYQKNERLKDKDSDWFKRDRAGNDEKSSKKGHSGRDYHLRHFYHKESDERSTRSKSPGKGRSETENRKRDRGRERESDRYTERERRR